MIRLALTTWVALNAAIPVALGTLRAAHERRYRRNVERIALGPAELRARLIDDLCDEFSREVDACLPEYVADWEAL